MLIRKENIDDESVLGVWEITESKEELLALFPDTLKMKAENHVAKIRSEKRAAEWLSVRLMLFLLLQEEKIVYHRTDGRPYLSDDSFNVSISHTKAHAAVLLHKSKNVGIDIEETSDRVHKVAGKFISDDEYIHEPAKNAHLLLHWSAKETMFKLLSESEIDFKQHLHLEKFIPQEKGVITAHETRSASRHRFNINYEVHPEYVLTWAIN